MKKNHAHIALLLLSVFATTVLPINLLHHHAEHEHLEAILNPQQAEHSCELDNHFCQPDLNQTCKHQAHIAVPVGKCFTCEFHFIKLFDNHRSPFVWKTDEKVTLIAQRVKTRLNKALSRISNKGPPFV